MRHLLTIAFLLCLCVSAHGATTLVARGTGNDATSGTTISVAPSGTLAVGSMGVMVLATNNAGSAGSTPICPASWTDAKGNIWTRGINPIYDPGAANAGVETAYYTASISVAWLSSDASTITFAGGESSASSAWAFWEVIPSVGLVMSYVTGAAGTGGASGTPTVTTSSITSGDVVIGGGGAESANTWNDDADSTNGTWSAGQEDAAGTGATGMSVTTQYKVVTGTATQTYNPTLTSVDQILGWIQLREVTPATSGFFFMFP